MGTFPTSITFLRSTKKHYEYFEIETFVYSDNDLGPSGAANALEFDGYFLYFSTLKSAIWDLTPD